VPNIKLQRTDIQTSGNGTLNISSQFDEISFSTGGVITDLNLSHTDLTFYYEILDNWVSLDLGLTARFFDGEAKITGSAADTLLAVTESIDIDAATPMLYGKAQFDLPFSGLALGADVNFAGFGGNGLIDYNVRISYMPDIIPLVDFGVELGYRSMQLELDGIGDLQTDFTIDGPYLSLIFHF
jgi:outer membrane protein